LTAQSSDSASPEIIASRTALPATNQSMGGSIVYSNFGGVNHHSWDRASGYLVEGSNYANQVVAQAFNSNTNARFSDVLLGMGVASGDRASEPKPLVFLESDTGGMPGAILDGPLTQINGIARFDAGSGMVQFDCVSCPRLSKGTTYWI